MPELLAAIGIPADRAIWLVPTEQFQREHYTRREWARELLGGAPDAEDLFETWMRRDATVGRLIALQARDLGDQVITVDEGVAAEEVFTAVSDWLPRTP